MKQTVLENIINVFQEKLDWEVDSFQTDQKLRHIQINTNQGVLRLVCEIKKSVIPSSIPLIRQTIEGLDLKTLNAHGTIILANYISTKARNVLHQSKINYVDTAGNIFLKHESIHIHIETGQSDRSAITNDRGRAFTKAGLKVLYQFFRSENRRNLSDELEFKAEAGPIADINSPYSNIAKQASVSKDTVSKVLQDLLDQGYLLRKNSKEFKWVDKKAVFERWVGRINEIMRPSLDQRKYRFVDEPINTEGLPPEYQLGGYYGAERCLHLTPSMQVINPPYLIYCHKPITKDIIQDLKLIPDPNGNITVIEAFWVDQYQISPSADFPVLYADLIYANTPRMLEIAQLIYTNFIDDHL